MKLRTLTFHSYRAGVHRARRNKRVLVVAWEQLTRNRRHFTPDGALRITPDLRIWSLAYARNKYTKRRLFVYSGSIEEMLLKST